MSKTCSKSKTRLKKDGSHNTSKTEQGQLLANNDDSKTVTARIQHDPVQSLANKDNSKTVTSRIQHYPGQSLANSNNSKKVTSRFQHAQGSKKGQVQELECSDPLEQRLCSQEALLDLSQDVDSQREVRWDYQSPETVKKLKKCQGQYSSKEIRSILSNFRDTPKDPLLQSVKFCLPSKDEVVVSGQSRLPKEKGRVFRRQRQRVQNRDSLQHMMQLFHDQTAQPKPDFKKLCQRFSEAPTSHLPTGHDSSIGDTSAGLSKSPVNDYDDNCWSDDELFQDNSFLIEATQNPEKFFNADQAPKQSMLGLNHPVANICKSVPKDSVIRSEACEPMIQDALLTDSFVVPPSYDPINPSTLCGKTSSLGSLQSSSFNVNKFQKLQSIELHNNATASTSLAGSTNRFSHFKGTTNLTDKIPSASAHNSKPPPIAVSRLVASTSTNSNIASDASLDKFVSQHSQSIIVDSLPGATYKTSFRKFNSFQVENSFSGIKNATHENNASSNSNLNSSFRKTLSFDSSLSATNHTYRKLSLPDFPELVSKPKSSQPAVNSRSEPDNVKSNMIENQVQWTCAAPCVLEDGFDVSLPDDVFQTLLEVDEILDSQADTTSTTNTLSLLCGPKAQQPDVVSENILQMSDPASGVTAAKLDALRSGVTSLQAAVNSYHFSRTTNNVLKKVSDKEVCDLPGTSSKQLGAPKLAETVLSPIRSVVRLHSSKQRTSSSSPTCAYFKKTFSLQKNSPHRLRVDKHLRSSLPSSSTPVKHVQSDKSQHKEDNDATLAKELSVSSLENVFDDSFSNDEALFESQILPVLEKLEAEAMVTQAEICNLTKCSSKEIEEKRQAALQKRSIRLSQASSASGHK